MKLYDFAFSPNCRKVRALAYELGIQLEFVPVDLPKGAQHTPAFLAINPNGRVPVLVEGELVLWESTAIVRYLAAKTGSALVPAAPRDTVMMLPPRRCFMPGRTLLSVRNVAVRFPSMDARHPSSVVSSIGPGGL